jgi:hypothetical protein
MSQIELKITLLLQLQKEHCYQHFSYITVGREAAKIPLNIQYFIPYHFHPLNSIPFQSIPFHSIDQ